METALATNTSLKQLLQGRHPDFWESLARATRDATDLSTLLALNVLRRRAITTGFFPATPLPPLKLAMLGGYTFHPLVEALEQLCFAEGWDLKSHLGDYDQYVAEMLSPSAELQNHQSEFLLVLPSETRCRYPGKLDDPFATVQAETERTARELISLCEKARKGLNAEILLGNFALPANPDPGAYRTKALASDWSFRKTVNLRLGQLAPSGVHLCDLEFLSAKLGTPRSADPQAWFETKQIGSALFLFALAKEITHLVRNIKRGPKKVLVTDLDETLWGGVIADAGLDGIELGDTNARGQAFKAFQRYLLSLQERGVLIAVCSKNDEHFALEPFLHHPEMVLKREHLVAFKANWSPKAQNIMQMAAELSLGLDAFVFVDDNPAEIENVRQFAPQVTAIHLGKDPADFISLLSEKRLFEPVSITGEDAKRTAQYQAREKARVELDQAVDMDSYLTSLGMEAQVNTFTSTDVPRITQLINKSNQFNLTTRRRTETDVEALLANKSISAFTVRLADRFADHGLIAVVIGEIKGKQFLIDTWLMSCRVLKRQVEEITVNEIVRRARQAKCDVVIGHYLPTEKNGMVKDLYPSMGFQKIKDGEFALDIKKYSVKVTKIKVTLRENDGT